MTKRKEKQNTTKKNVFLNYYCKQLYVITKQNENQTKQKKPKKKQNIFANIVLREHHRIQHLAAQSKPLRLLVYSIHIHEFIYLWFKTTSHIVLCKYNIYIINYYLKTHPHPHTRTLLDPPHQNTT